MDLDPGKRYGSHNTDILCVQVASVGYRYRKYELGNDLVLVCRCEVDAVLPVRKLLNLNNNNCRNIIIIHLKDVENSLLSKCLT